MKKITINPCKIIVFQLVYNVFVKYLINDFGFPSFLNYFTDFITLVLFILYLKDGLVITKRESIFVLLCAIFFILGLISIIFSSESFLLYMWSLRTYGRFFIWVLIVAKYFHIEKLDDLFRKANQFLIINFILMIFQYFFLGLRSDYLNGFFGSYTGGNAALNTFFVILTIENFTSWILKKRPARQCLFYIVLMCLMSAMNEIKYYYVEFALIAGLSMIVSMKGVKQKKFLQRAVKVAFVTIILVFIGHEVLITLYPGFANFFEKEILLDYLTRSYNSNKILYVHGVPISNRFSSYGIINKYFLTDIIKNYIGIGMGVSEYTTFFQSKFHKIYGKIALSGYLFPQILLETGIIGLLTYASIYLVFFFQAYKLTIKEKDISYKVFYLTSAITAILGIFMCAYNSALKIESSGYIFFFIMAIPYVTKKKRRKNYL